MDQNTKNKSMSAQIVGGSVNENVRRAFGEWGRGLELLEVQEIIHRKGKKGDWSTVVRFENEPGRVFGSDGGIYYGRYFIPEAKLQELENAVKTAANKMEFRQEDAFIPTTQLIEAMEEVIHRFKKQEPWEVYDAVLQFACRVYEELTPKLGEE